MVVYESRWPVGRVVYIYNLACSLSHLDHHGRGPTLALQAFGLPPIQKKNLHLALTSHTVLLQAPTSRRHSAQPHHTTTTTLEICIRIY